MKHKGELFGVNNLFKRLLAQGHPPLYFSQMLENKRSCRNAKLPQVLSPMTRSDVKGTKVFSLFTSNFSSNFGFSLAEVLITLGIIGLLAAMTIPTLISNYQKTQYVIQLKKAYTEFNQALKQMAADYGCVNNLICTGLFNNDGPTGHQMLGEELVKYFNVVKNCETNTNQGCFAITNNNYDGLSPTNRNVDNEGFYEFITTDGMSFVVRNDYNGTDYSFGKTGNMRQKCGGLIVDVNGPKKGPNHEGRDVFQFHITNGKGALLYPMGGIDDKHNGWWKTPTPNRCSPGNENGSYCAARVMEEGWEMNY